MPASPPALDPAHAQALGRTGAAAVGGLEAVEALLRQLHPPRMDSQREGLSAVAQRLEESLEELARSDGPPELEAFERQLQRGAELVGGSLEGFAEAGDAASAVGRVLGAMRLHARAQEALYPLRQALPGLGRFFAEPSWHARLEQLDPEPADGASVGLHAAGAGEGPDARGGFHLYVPERYRGDADWPLVVALHGGFGHGRDFLWTWLREARSRGFLLLAPTSQATTWSLNAPDRDEPMLRSMIAYVAERWRVDRARILLTGLSDGGTYALLAGLAEDAPYSAMAVVSGVLHPRNLAAGNLGRAGGRRVYVAHGALDWMFPVGLARAGQEALRQAGADVCYREIPDLSHAYPREENARILAWFDPSLAD